MQGRPLVVGLDDQPFAFGRCVLQQLGIEQPTPADEVSCHAADVLCRLQPHARGWQLVRARPCDAGAVPLFHPHPPRPLPGPLGGLTGQDAPPQWLCPGATPTVALDQSNRNVGVAVCCLVERANMVLLTRRAAHLHAFPSVWVLPGGHVDAGESLAQAAARELREETGIECDTAQLVPFALFESMYPPEALAVPVRHHVVMFFRLQLRDGHVEVTCQQAEGCASLVAAFFFFSSSIQWMLGAGWTAPRWGAGSWMASPALTPTTNSITSWFHRGASRPVPCWLCKAIQTPTV